MSAVSRVRSRGGPGPELGSGVSIIFRPCVSSVGGSWGEAREMNSGNVLSAVSFHLESVS